MAVELGVNRSQDHRTFAHGLSNESVDIVDVQVQFDRRSTETLGAHGTEVWILVRDKDPCGAEAQFSMTDPTVAGVDQRKVERCAEGSDVEVNRLLRPLDDQVRQSCWGWSGMVEPPWAGV